MTSYMKFSPQTLDDVVLPAALRASFCQMLAVGVVEPMLFYGRPGTGKSLTATLLSPKNHIVFRCDGVDTATKVIDDAWRAASSIDLFEPEIRRVIVLDELDRFSEPMQQKCRALVDGRARVATFIATTNHLDRIIPALQSRLLPVSFDVAKGNITMLATWQEWLVKKYQELYDQPIDADHLRQCLTYFPDGRRMLSAMVTGLIS
jgi:replication-associated recombination protein RarA